MKAFTACCLILAALAAQSECRPNGYGPSGNGYAVSVSAPAYSAPAVDYFEVPAGQPVPIYPSLLNDNFLPSYQAPLTFLPPAYAVLPANAQPAVGNPLYVQLPAVQQQPQQYSAPSAPAPGSSYSGPSSY